MEQCGYVDRIFGCQFFSDSYNWKMTWACSLTVTFRRTVITQFQNLNGALSSRKRKESASRRRSWYLLEAMDLQPEKCWCVAGGTGCTVVSAVTLHGQIELAQYSTRQPGANRFPEMPPCRLHKVADFTTSLAHLSMKLLTKYYAFWGVIHIFDDFLASFCSQW